MPDPSSIRVLFLGDVVGTPGRQALQQHLPGLIAELRPHRVIANAENARNGSGLSPEIAEKLLGLSIHGLTLGDHAFRDHRVVPLLEAADSRVIRPANLSAKAPGRRLLRIPADSTCPREVFVFTVLGRIGMNLPADDPFATADATLSTIPERNPIVIVEAHMEATSEKVALAHHLDGRVSAVVGTHTHVPTADARVLRQGTGFISDLGMTGPYDSVIGRDATAVLRHMTTGVHVAYEVAQGGERVAGVLVEIDAQTARCRSMRSVVVPSFA